MAERVLTAETADRRRKITKRMRENWAKLESTPQGIAKRQATFLAGVGFKVDAGGDLVAPWGAQYSIEDEGYEIFQWDIAESGEAGDKSDAA